MIYLSSHPKEGMQQQQLRGRGSHLVSFFSGPEAEAASNFVSPLYPDKLAGSEGVTCTLSVTFLTFTEKIREQNSYLCKEENSSEQNSW